MIDFSVPAVPVAQPRQRVTMIAGHASTYTPTKHPVNAFKASVRLAYSDATDLPPFDGPLELRVMFVMPRPKAMTRKARPNPRVYHAKKPDLDNLLKSLKDALTKLAWHDDSQVCLVDAVKVYASADEAPHVDVTILSLTKEPTQ